MDQKIGQRRKGSARNYRYIAHAGSLFMTMRPITMDREIPHSKLMHIDREASVQQPIQLMRQIGTTALMVTEEINGVHHKVGIVTANEIVARVIAMALDPAVLTTGDIALA